MVPRCSTVRACTSAGSLIFGRRKHRPLSTKLRPVPSAVLHILSPGRRESCLATPRLLGTIVRRGEWLPQVYRICSECRLSEAGARHTPSVSELYVRHRRELRQYCRGPTSGAIVTCRGLELLITSGSLRFKNRLDMDVQSGAYKSLCLLSPTSSSIK